MVIGKGLFTGERERGQVPGARDAPACLAAIANQCHHACVLRNGVDRGKLSANIPVIDRKACGRASEAENAKANRADRDPAPRLLRDVARLDL